jgi:hypothetical protein
MDLNDVKKGNIPKNGEKAELLTIEPLTSRFPYGNLDLDFFARKSKLKYKNIPTRYTVLFHTVISS